MSNNLQKAFLATTALYLFIGGLAFASIFQFFHQDTQETSTQVNLACFKEPIEKAKLPEEVKKQESKKIEKTPQKQLSNQVSKEPIKPEQKQFVEPAQNIIHQIQKPQETAGIQKQFNDLNGQKIREILARHANNSYAQKARNNGVTGTCKVSFVLHPDGTVSDKDISDCHIWLKTSAKIAIEDAASELPKPRDNCKITTSIDYEIIRG